MSANPSEIRPAAQAIKANHVVLQGKVASVKPFKSREGKQLFELLVLIAAADAFSHPGKVQVVVSDRPSVGEDFRGVFRLTGYGRRWTNKDTGEVRDFADIKLMAVEGA